MLNVAKRSPSNFRQKIRALEPLQSKILACNECSLHKFRKHVLPGRIVEPSEAVVVDLMPHETEDASGEILEGGRGRGLAKLFSIGSPSLDLNKMSFLTVYKCRGEINDDRCLEYIDEQIRILDPVIVISLGQETTQKITGMPDLKNGSIYVTGEQKQFAFCPVMHPREVIALKDKNIPVWKESMTKIGVLAAEYDLKILVS